MANNWINHMLSDAANFEKYFVGADKFFNTLAKAHDTFAKSVPGYPPYNIAKVDDNKYVIEMAVAGFGKHNIDLELQDGTLTIKGGLNLDEIESPYKDPTGTMQYIYKGIADRVFTRKFTLADSVEVKNAELVNGMLKVWLENIILEEKKPKKININEPGEKESKSELLME